MKKVKQVWFDDELDLTKRKEIRTGLVLELEDGTMMQHLADAPVVPFSEVTDDNNN